MRLALCGAVALLTHPTFAQTGQTVDDYVTPYDAIAQAMAKDPLGNLYAAGLGAIDANFDTLAVVKKSTDGGATWSVVDTFSNGEAAPFYEYNAITSDRVGNLYAVGDGNGWFARRSLDGGSSWSTVDTLAGIAHGVATDAAGNVYVAGDNSANQSWIVRKGTGTGTSWSTVDTFSPGGYGSARAVLCHPTAGIFITGTGYGGGRKGADQQWYVRRSLDNGATWTTVDAYLGGSSRGIGMDSYGSVYVVGINANHWIVRKSSNGGTSWATVDDFFPSTTTVSPQPPYKTQTTYYPAIAEEFAADANGNLFVVGIRNGPGASQWVIRMNPGGTGSWQTVNTFQYVSGKEAMAYGITADSSGHVLVGGFGADAASVYHWLVRKY